VIDGSIGKNRHFTFLIETVRNLQEHCDSRTIKKIADHFHVQYNEKLKKEKLETKGKVKKPKAPTLVGGGAKGYDRNNNTAMINDVMGEEKQYGDEYGDEYGDYGDEAAFSKEKEAAFDFM